MVLSDEVVKGPEVFFFLEDDVFEHASCCCIPAFECFSDDLAVKRYCAAFKCVVKPRKVLGGVTNNWQWIWFKCGFAFKEVDAFAYFLLGDPFPA